VDLARWQEWRGRLVGGLLRGIHQLLAAAGVTVAAGELRFTRPDQVVLDTPSGTARYYQFTDVLIATGSRPATPGGLRVDGERVLDAAGLLGITQVPARLAVVGAGCTGVELGTAFAKLGSQVTLIERAERILPGLDEHLTRPVQRRLRALGVQVLTRTTATGDDGAAVQMTCAGETGTVPADLVLVATGRTPNTDELGLDRLGITPLPDGRLPVGPDRRIGRHVAAAGDVTPGISLAHTASAEALIAVAALSGQRVAYQPQATPIVVFSDPQIATAGLTMTQARDQGIDAVEADVPLAASGRARTMTAPSGVIRIVADAADGSVLGAHLAGPHASELIGAAVLAIEMAATVDDLAQMVLPHPTISELWGESARLAQGLPVQVPQPRGV
jgi:dihydrolipoamide dehydrogenase